MYTTRALYVKTNESKTQSLGSTPNPDSCPGEKRRTAQPEVGLPYCRAEWVVVSETQQTCCYSEDPSNSCSDNSLILVRRNHAIVLLQYTSAQMPQKTMTQWIYTASS